MKKKSCIGIIVLLGFIFYVFTFLDKVAREGGIIGVLAGIAAAIGVGAGYYVLFFRNGNNKTNNK